MKSISVVLPNYNGRGLLEKNLPGLFSALRKAGCDFEVIVSDDCSSDDSVSFLKAHYPAIILLENKQNLGFAGNINTGIRQCRKDLVFLLNTDIELTDDYFIPLFAYFDHPTTFGVMGRIIALDSEAVQDGAKYPLYRNGNLTATLNFLPQNILAGENHPKIPSLFLSGANALVDRKKLLEIGCFQELFNPFYWEDVELGIKAWRMGYACYYEHASICRHPASATIGKHHQKKTVALIARRNKILFHYLHLENTALFSWMLLYSLKAFFRCLTFNVSYLKSLTLFLKQYRAASAEKKRFREQQKLAGTEQRSLKKVSRIIREQLENTSLRTF